AQAHGQVYLPVGAFQPEVPRIRGQVAAVQLGICAGLFDHEHLDPQLEQFVQRGGVEVFGPAAAQRDGHCAATVMGLSNLSTFVPHDQTSSNSDGSFDS